MTSLILASSLAIAQTGSLSLSPPRIWQGLRPTNFAAAPSGSRFVASLEDRTLRIIDANTRQTLRTFTGHPQTAYAVAWSPNGKTIASGDESGRIFFWDAATGKKVREMRTHTRGVQAISFDRTGSAIVSTGKDDTIRFYQVATGKELKVVPGKGANLYGGKFIPGTNDVVVASLADGVRVYSKYAMTRNFTGHPAPEAGAWDVDVSSGRAASGGRDGTTIIYDFKAGKKAQTLRGHGDWVVRTTFSPNGRFLATSSADSSVRVWDMRGFKSVATISQQSMVGAPLLWTADGKYLLSAGADDFMVVFTVTPPQPAARK